MSKRKKKNDFHIFTQLPAKTSSSGAPYSPNVGLIKLKIYIDLPLTVVYFMVLRSSISVLFQQRVLWYALKAGPVSVRHFASISLC